MIRTRFAPSPTGELHIGNIRTALFNWLFTRNKRGKIILRIEDTDISRSDDSSVNSILDSLMWLGLDWDEGPYRQSDRLDIYKRYATKLLEDKKAYLCFCTEEELQKKRELALQKGISPKYDGKCRVLSDKEARKLKGQNIPYTVRFKLPVMPIAINDLIRGEIQFHSLALGDFIIIKSNGTPSYNFACVIDDFLMKITHVIRAEDHLTNTARQFLLYKALGFNAIPKFAHLPMILGSDHTPLSKRHGVTSITDFKKKGYLKESIINYLGILGYSSRDENNIFSVEELIERFTIDNISKTSAVFDIKKLRWLNAYYIKTKEENELLKYAKSFIPTTWENSSAWFINALNLIKTSIHTLDEIPVHLRYFFEEVNLSDDAKQVLYVERAKKVLLVFKEKLIKIDLFTEESVKAILKEIAKITGEKGKNLYLPIRSALTGSTHGPELIKIICLLGKEGCIKKISRFI